MNENNFKVYTLQGISSDTPGWHHWSEGLSMYIEKDGVALKLDKTEMQQLVKALPRTFGGEY